MDAQDTGTELAPAEGQKPTSKKKKLILGAVAAVVLLGGAGAGVSMMMGGEEAKAETHAEVAYVEIPAMLINIRSAEGRQRFLKVRLTLEVAPEAKEGIEKKMPAVIDSMQVFLREIRPEDLGGTSAMFRIKEELLVRADRSIGSGQVSDVLIQELVQQ
jgi:flagellar FliL protein